MRLWSTIQASSFHQLPNHRECCRPISQPSSCTSDLTERMIRKDSGGKARGLNKGQVRWIKHINNLMDPPSKTVSSSENTFSNRFRKGDVLSQLNQARGQSLKTKLGLGSALKVCQQLRMGSHTTHTWIKNVNIRLLMYTVWLNQLRVTR